MRASKMTRSLIESVPLVGMAERLQVPGATIIAGRPWNTILDVATTIRAAANADAIASGHRGMAGSDVTDDHGEVPPNIKRSPMIKIMFLMVKKEGMSTPDFHRYWLNMHSPIVIERADAMRMRRYVQSHAIPSANAAGATEARGWDPNPFYGVAEVCWDSEEDMADAFSTPAGMAAGEALAQDEKEFMSRDSLIMMTREYLIFDKTR